MANNSVLHDALTALLNEQHMDCHHAIQEAQRAGFSEVNGINVLLAIFTEPESQAVYF